MRDDGLIILRNDESFWGGLIVIGDLPRWKTRRFFKMVKNTEIFQSGIIVMGDLPRCNIFRGGEKCEDF